MRSTSQEETMWTAGAPQVPGFPFPEPQTRQREDRDKVKNIFFLWELVALQTC